MNHSEVGARPGPANTAAFPFSSAMPMRRGGYPSAGTDAFADLFAHLSRPQPQRRGDDAAERPPQTDQKVAGHDREAAGDDDTDDDSPSPTTERHPVPLAPTELTEETSGTTQVGNPPPVATDRSPGQKDGPNGDTPAAAAGDESVTSAVQEPSTAPQEPVPPPPIGIDAAEKRLGDAAITLDRKPDPGGDHDRHGGSPSDADPRAGMITRERSASGAENEPDPVGRDEPGEQPSEMPEAEGSSGPDMGAWDPQDGRSRRRERRESGRHAGREPSERERKESQSLADLRPVSDAPVRGPTTIEQAAGLAFHDPSASASDPTAFSGGGASGPNEVTPSVGSGGMTGVAKAASDAPASGLSPAGGGETAPMARSAAPDGIASGPEGNPTSRGQAAPATPSSAAEAEGQIDTAARVRLIQRVSRAFQQLGASGGIVRMKLAPAELGSIRIEMRVQDRQVEARVVAESEAASQLLRDHLAELRQRLESQGLRVERFDVRTEADAESWTDGDWHHGDRDDHPAGGDGGQDRQTSRHRRGQPSSRGDRIETPSRGTSVSTDRPINPAPVGGRPAIDASW